MSSYDSAAAGDYKWSYRLIVKNPAGGAIYGLGYADAPADKQTGPNSKSVKVTLPQARIEYEFKVVATGKGAKAGYTGTQASTTVPRMAAAEPSRASAALRQTCPREYCDARIPLNTE
jgi:hypothetical protein